MENDFVRSKESSDINGNNLAHYVFEISDLPTRYKFLKLILEKGVGSLTKPNYLGYLPHEIEYEQPLSELPESIHPFF